MSRKGPQWERDFCRSLSLWFSGGDPDADWFWRTAGSGGRATSRRKKGKSAGRHCGDVCAIAPEGEPLLRVFSVELKRGYNRCTIQDLLDAPARGALKGVKQEYEKWLAQAEASRGAAGALYWLIVHKRDGREPLVLTSPDFVHRLLFAGYSWRGAGGKIEAKHPERGAVVAATLGDFFENVSPEGVRALSESC
jgi:hypothetical protein